MPILKSKKTTYEFSPDDIKLLVAKDIGVPVDAIIVRFVQQDISDDRFEHTPDYQVTKIEVIVDDTKLKSY